jgi:N-methylhydantoinase B/oxoprolinase/acetone carboxylase alpha subunit
MTNLVKSDMGSGPTAVSLSIFRHLFASVAEEMGVTLGRAAYSPNIKERLDFSCALFLGDGRLLAQAAHIPVHLGAMPASVRAAINACAPFQPGDVVILNDPYQGGNHLPDVTLVSPVFVSEQGSGGEEEQGSRGVGGRGRITAGPPAPSLPRPPTFFVASRAHHADVGGMSPGSMPLSTELFQEGIIIPPIKLVAGGRRNEAVWQLILRNVRTPAEREGDLAAQLAAHHTGATRLGEIVARYGLAEALAHAEALIAYAARLTRAAIAQMPPGRYTFTDYLDNDGQTAVPIPICATVIIEGEGLTVDFSGTATAVAGNLNAVPAITQSAVAYCLRCVALALLQTDLPMNDGLFAPLTLQIPAGSLLDPHPPHAVAAGNVETSQRIVDAVFGAFAQALPDLIPAASQGTMNNLTFGGLHPSPAPPPPRSPAPTPFAYYETIGGGAGAGPQGDGASGVHVHMSNTRNTPVEALEYSFPLRVRRYALRHQSGGRGQRVGGDGLVRALEFLVPVRASLITERRERPSYGLQGGEPGQPGRNSLIRQGEETPLPGKITLDLAAGDILQIETPGGGGWGALE